ncbi:MAG: F0F1 ATP synthase subunit A [Fervidobacterium sp.]|uniref:ATP synthase subunit a n=1 Tax=Fervidobacterium gondwanense DSM 13020 TaxID=1121883 RepID=A0A1M7SBZ5_FERGO|nr:F0F1 ATP synthase subunit A [Fervidobacterium gondwanense]SHN56040.1 ATP synthase F0 subcomplex A subunit [Fervidobacterium gondwanense DSM 13020]
MTKRKMSKKAKIQLIVFLIVYTVIGIINARTMTASPKEALSNVTNRWVVQFGPENVWYYRINPATVIMSLVVITILVAFARSVYKEFSIIPGRKQAFAESLLEFMYDMVQSSIPNEKYARTVFKISMTLFLYIALSNLIGGFVPGISPNVSILADGTRSVKFVFFNDTWPAPTGDLNTNVTYAVMVFIMSQYFAIKTKGVKGWLKGFLEPIAFMLPMNIVGELAKPLSHSMRLFGNITGGGILVLVVSYFLKYMFLPPFLWGYFGIFSGLIQAFVFSTLAVAYMASQIE